jgi:hypothetical protein
VIACGFEAITLQKKHKDHQWISPPDDMKAIMDIYQG